MSQNKPSASVIASSIVGICGSLLTLLFAAFGIFGVMLAKQGTQGRSPVPPGTAGMAMTGIVFIFALGIFGIFSAVGLWRLKNWARISFLVFSGATVLVCACALAMVLLILKSTAVPDSPPNIAGFLRGFMLIIYGIPILIGAWWLVLFNRRAVAAQFLPDPKLLADGVTPAPDKPSCPLPLAILAGFYVLAAAFMPFYFFMPIRFPVIVFGHPFNGDTATAIYVAMCVLLLVAAIGLLRLARWSFPLAAAYQFFWLVSATVSLFNPNTQTAMNAALAKLQSSDPNPYASPLTYQQHFAAISAFGLVFAAAVLAVILFYRSAFYEQIDRKFRPASK